MKRLLSLILLASCASCRPLRSNDICLIDSDARIADCARLKKKYQLKFPEQMIGWSAFDVSDFLFISNMLEQCEQDGKLPRKDYLAEMDICIIDAQSCGRKSLRSIDNFYAFEPLTMQKLRQRINNCIR